MTIEDARQYFGSGYKVCKVLGIARQNYTYWKRQGYIPEMQQYKLELITQGKIKADWVKRDE